MKYQILLYYKYTPIENPVHTMREQKRLCEKLGLKGRIIIATEGINGTVEGTTSSTGKYIEEMSKDPRFSDINWKKSIGTGSAFPKLKVKVREEIVSLHLHDKDIKPWNITGKYLEAEELHKWFENKKEFYIVDMRNDYEHKSGYFEGSILPPFSNFRDLSELLPVLNNLKDKTILTVCTGGVRCEKASGFLVKNGFKDVYQLKNGIVTYMEKYPNEHFKGKLYVFDQRILMGFNTDSEKHEIVGKCERCLKLSENYINCDTVGCHRHLILCESCIEKFSKICPNGCTYLRKKQRENPVHGIVGH
jgi:UPF0176 protein